MLATPLNMKRASWLARLDIAWYWRYGIAVVTVAIALALTLLLPAIRTGSPFMFFYLAVTCSVLLGNFRAGLLAIVLSCLVATVWIMPPVGIFQISQDNVVRVLGFLVVATLASTLGYAVNRAHHTVYQQAEWLRVTLSSIGDAVIATDVQGNVVWQNAVASALTGWPIEIAAGKPLAQIFQIINERTRLPVENPVDRVLIEGRVVGLANHSVLIAPDGTERPIEDSAAPIRNASDQMIGVVLIFHDVSERRAREVELQTTQERLQMALKAGRMVAWEWNVPRAEIWTTENFPDIYGTSIQRTLEGQQLLHPDDVARHQDAVQRAAEEDGGYNLDFRIIRPDDGRLVWIEESGFTIPSTGDGADKGIDKKVAGISVDITTRKHAEEEIRRLNLELAQRVQESQAVFDLALVGIGVTYDPSCEVVERNQILADWLGVAKGKGPSKSSPVAGQLPFQLLRNGKEVAPAELPLQRAIAEGKSIVNQELELVRNDGFRLTVTVSTRPIFDDDGRVTGCIGIYADITERKAAELALREMNQTLELRVAERTIELEQINYELVEFTNVVSHDLRAPLRAITTLSEWIRDEADAVLPARTKDYLVKMRQRVERMEKLLNDLTAYTRAGRVHYQKEQVNTAVLVKDIFHLVDAPAGFSAEVVEPMPIFVTERVPLETVLRNLIGNAVKHHHSPTKGKVKVLARDLGHWFEFQVTDDGFGIAPEYRDRIFGVFQTLRPRDELEGSGMGLAIAKRLVEGRGGHIGVESHPREGSNFRFTWPKS